MRFAEQIHIPDSVFEFIVILCVFILDVTRSAQLVVKLKAYAEDNDVIVRYEALKTHIRQRRESIALKYHFFRPFRSDLPLSQHLLQMQETLETRIRRK